MNPYGVEGESSPRPPHLALAPMDGNLFFVNGSVGW
jgi:hypothetical protein